MAKPNLSPSKRDIEQLFRHEMDVGWTMDHPEYAALDVEIKAIEDDLLDNKKLRDLKRKRDRLGEQIRLARKKLHLKKTELRREFLSKGVTPEILKKIDALIKEINKAKVS